MTADTNVTSHGATTRVEEPSQLREGTYLANRLFTDEAIFDDEVSELFLRTWNFVCHASELPNVGSFRTVEIGRVPIVIVRSADGIRGFINVCRHRGAEVVREPAGKLSALQCFYHLFTYSLRGELVQDGAPLTGVPAFEGYQDTPFRKEDFPLAEVDVGVVANLIFAKVAAGGETLDEYLGGAKDAIERVVSPDLEVFHYHAADMQTNWKLFSDNNRELYHGYLHYLVRNTLAFWDDQREQHRWQIFDNGHLAFGDPQMGTIDYSKAGYEGRSELLRDPLPGFTEGAVSTVYLFPDTMILVRSSVMRIDRMAPHAAGKTRVEFRGLGVAGDSDKVRNNRIRAHNLVWGPFGRILPEDIFAVESQWRAMSSGAVPWSVIAREQSFTGMDDVSLRHFYSEWSRRVGRSLDTGARIEHG